MKRLVIALAALLLLGAANPAVDASHLVCLCGVWVSEEGGRLPEESWTSLLRGM